ncbi:MAG TPA: HAD hydrolase-like protein, partial [Novosphingobium sp.]|nr:HAD hydrolase-like protein [Novosphingobium sp.]
VAMEKVRDLVGGGTRMMLERALAITGGPLPADELRALSATLVAHYEAHIADHSRLFPGGEAMLDALAATGAKLAVVTNKLEHLAVKLLAELGLAERFYTIIGGDTLGPGRAKPRPDLLQEMVARAGLPARPRAAYVGDTSFDTGAAQAAGLPCVVVRFGFNDRPAEELGGSAIIDHYDELVPALARLGADAD